MQITAYKTKKVRPSDDLYHILDESLPRLKEKSIVAVTSKIVSLCQNRVVKDDGHVSKKELTEQEADLIMDHPDHLAKFGFNITIKNQTLISSAGIDLSNSGGFFVLWPKNPQQTANQIWKFLIKKHHLKYLGVIITDSHTLPLRWGVIGTCLAHCGFLALNDYRGKSDLFGRKYQVTQVNLNEALAVSAVLTMGEGSEQTPLVLISDLPQVRFQNRPPTKKELTDLIINPEDDLYAPLLTAARWRKSKHLNPKLSTLTSKV